MFGGLFITFLLPFPYAPRLKLRLVGTITVLQPLAYMQALCFWLEFGLSNMCVCIRMVVVIITPSHW